MRCLECLLCLMKNLNTFHLFFLTFLLNLLILSHFFVFWIVLVFCILKPLVLKILIHRKCLNFCFLMSSFRISDLFVCDKFQFFLFLRLFDSFQRFLLFEQVESGSSTLGFGEKLQKVCNFRRFFLSLSSSVRLFHLFCKWILTLC